MKWVKNSAFLELWNSRRFKKNVLIANNILLPTEYKYFSQNIINNQRPPVTVVKQDINKTTLSSCQNINKRTLCSHKNGKHPQLLANLSGYSFFINDNTSIYPSCMDLDFFLFIGLSLD